MSAPSTISDMERWAHLYSNERVFDEPILLEAEVVHGFKRGSKDLGIPTANLNMDQLGAKGQEIETGIYYGWASLKGQVYPSVVSVGWNPFYKNEKKTIEAHLLVPMDDFYGETISTLFCGYLRPEANFNGLEELISCIRSDIEKTKINLNREPCSQFQSLENWKK